MGGQNRRQGAGLRGRTAGHRLGEPGGEPFGLGRAAEMVNGDPGRSAGRDATSAATISSSRATALAADLTFSSGTIFPFSTARMGLMDNMVPSSEAAAPIRPPVAQLLKTRNIEVHLGEGQPFLSETPRTSAAFLPSDAAMIPPPGS